jgi:outer membrane protein assembly factor BamA
MTYAVGIRMHNGAGMKTISFLIVFALFLSPLSLWAQQAGINARGIVDSAEISGIDENQLSQEIRDAVRKLIGQPFDQSAADDLIMRIQVEKPEFTATTRLLAGNEPDHVKVSFLLEKNTGEDNVNSRYIVERVEIEGFDESKLSQPIRDDIKKLVGEKLDQDRANRIQDRIKDELRPKYSVNRRVAKGNDRQHIVVVYEIKRVLWIPFFDTEHIVYHSKQNFSAVVGGGFGSDSARFRFGLADDQDQLLERFAGFNLSFQARRIGTDRLGLALRYARYHDRWQPATVLADQSAIYRERSAFDPTITFAFDPRLRLSAGISLSDLQMQYPAIHGENSNAAVASLNFNNVWGSTDKGKHSVQLSYGFSAGNHTLDSDFIYTRHVAQVEYLYSDTRQDLLLRFSAGTLAGSAPLFDLFSLGNTSTLRGWNKFDIAPAGGNRMASGTVQYGFQLWGGHARGKNININTDPLAFHVFYDSGVVGDRGVPMKVRHSVGFGFGDREPGGFFMELGFPIRSSHVVPIFMTGFRF